MSGHASGRAYINKGPFRGRKEVPMLGSPREATGGARREAASVRGGGRIRGLDAPRNVLFNRVTAEDLDPSTPLCTNDRRVK